MENCEINAQFPEGDGDVETTYATHVPVENSDISQQMPVELDCATDLVPNLGKGQHKVRVMDGGITMTFYLFKHYRLAMYSFLNQELHNGNLSDVVGFHVLNRVINKEACSFPDKGVSFWRIDRKHIYADVKLDMKLHSKEGVQNWQGVLVCIISFESEDKITFSGEAIMRAADYKDDGCILLSPFLIGYHTNRDMDVIAEGIWKKYDMAEALTNPKKRDPVELARRMGLTVMYVDVYEHNGIPAILFFKEGEILTGEDRRDWLTREYRKTKNPKPMTISVNTIVVNTNVVSKKVAAFAIFHECIHYEEHYLFFRLQELGNSDPKGMKTTEREVGEGQEVRDPIIFMERQADRGAFGLMMPAAHMEKIIRQECARVKEYKNEGEMYEIAGLSLAETLDLPHFRIRARMIQLGHYQAKGALNYVDRRMIQPFAFERDSLAVEVLTFVIGSGALENLLKKSARLRELLDSKRYIYADGHVVRNDPRFVEWRGGELLLTDWARGNVDVCCLRFIKVYVQQMVGRFVFGRMYCDEKYITRTLEFLEDIMRAEKMDDIDAKIAYKERFPRNFVNAFDQIMKWNRYTRESTAADLGITTRTLYNKLNNPSQKLLDLIVTVSLIWQLPDWISTMLLDRAGIKLSEYDRRHQAIEHIIHVLWSEGVERANQYLIARKLNPLQI